MKILKLLFCLLMTVCFVSCSNDEKDPRLKNITSSGCKFDIGRSLLGAPESLSYEVKKGMLIITLYNYDVPCDVTQIGAEISIDKDKIVLTTKRLDGGYANCICPMDVTFPISGLVDGKTYQCVVIPQYLPYSFEFTFKEGAKGTINPYKNE